MKNPEAVPLGNRRKECRKARTRRTEENLNGDGLPRADARGRFTTPIVWKMSEVYRRPTESGTELQPFG